MSERVVPVLRTATDWQTMARALHRAAMAVARRSGPSLFDDLAAELADGLGVSLVLIAELDSDGSRLRSLAGRLDGGPTLPVELALPASLQACIDTGAFQRGDSPDLARVMGAEGMSGFAAMPLSAGEGQCLGVLVAMDREPLRDAELAESMLTIFGTRVAAELERRRSDEALRLREEQYRVIFEAASDGFVLRDAQLRTLDANPAFYRMYGFDRAHIAAGGGYPAHFPRDYIEQRDSQIWHALAGQETHVESIALRADGSEFWIELRVIPVRYRGEPHVLQVVRDITARRQAEAQREALEAQLRQAQKMEAIGQLTGGIAHDFNNILTSVIGYIVLAIERVELMKDARLSHQLAQAHLAAQRARDLIAQMLTFARRGRSERKAVLLAPLLRQSLTLLRATLPSSVELDIDFAVGLPAVAANAGQIEQVLFNLCINARDAMNSMGRLGVGLRRQRLDTCCASCREAVSGEWIELSVSDEGSGLSADVRERMFDPFYTTKEIGRGSGMGLPMVHGIVHEHGGHVVVDSEPGRGSVFRVLLPIAAAGAEVASEPARLEPSSRPELVGRLLLVEDEAMVAAFMCELLQGWGLTVTACRDPIDAQRLFAQDPQAFDVVLTDQAMPRLIGTALAQNLLALRPGLPVLLYTGRDEGLDGVDLGRVGLRAVLCKPVDDDQLLLALRACL